MTTALITLHKPNSTNAVTLNASFKKSLSTSKCIIALANNNLFVGFYIVTPYKRIQPIFQPQHCTLMDPNSGLGHEFLIGHGSNDPRFLRAEYVRIKVTGTFACLSTTSLSYC